MDLTSFEWIYPLGPIIYAIIGAVIGDGFLIIIGFLQSQGIIKNYWPALFAFLGLYLSDVIFYFIGRSKYFEKLKKRKRAKKIIGRINITIDFITRKNLLLALFYSKFISGAKLIMNIYLGEKKVPIRKFLLLNLAMAIFWTIITWTIGYLTGEGIIWIFKYFESITLASLSAIIIVIIFFNLSKKTKRHLEKKYGP